VTERTFLVSPDGMLGRAFDALLASRTGEVHESACFPEVDLTRPETFARIERFEPTRVVLCAAYTDVDGAEDQEALATAINGDGVGALAARCARLGATLVHFGTDYVFDGRGRAPYPVDAPLAPQGAYARSKARGEVLLRESQADHLYVRTSWLYAPWGKNFVRTIARNARVRPQLKVVDDQRGRPTSAEHLARTTLALLDRGARGTFHVTDGGECTWFELARAVVEGLGLADRCRVLPCTSAEWPSPVARPAYSVLDLSRTEALLGPMPSWRENLADVLARLEA
jgi:dTDP-4-dehydrorhamnose reductase